ncbi:MULTISPECIES: DMT family transporter [unclassified Novosphingobium]|uniref:EamA family transporter n=1 Tax=unclassified Novosphingobium TaxID=2644732 RepID=UPI001441A4D9|nr:MULTISPECIES: EamA family transporter [unclassified Novosphingobium]MBB3359270.1 inner membrane transporter RhtA [Novosphingobium sp. BK256]MBB3375249.1 inner membrane transporter RhtA [Novosphingobium sp. BK280]MBB3380043.1 inner membrane transporter RhtA [Novosphingobium sp. BK258]MBB3421737.1 inner membrane transporter RhtA [Novosphingobium sp. BK267]MBB3450052.1 inner membrane transporter RhtA [Novosphingobium sp. BK352]
MSRTTSRATLAGACATLSAQVSGNLGAGFAKQLFPLVGAGGATLLRVALAALVLLAWRRPWRRPVPRALWPGLAAYGAILGIMNLLIYQAFSHIPIGIAVGVEVMGPLAIVLAASRRPHDFLWLACAVAGLALLLPWHPGQTLDPRGLLLAGGAAVCWASYIVTGRHVAAALGTDAVAWGMAVAAVVVVPILVLLSGSPALLMPHALATGLAIAILSSALPYGLEIEAMRRLPAGVFGMLLSAAPAVAALTGWALLGERLTPDQWLAIGLIVLASAGTAATSAQRARAVAQAASSSGTKSG